MLPCHLPTLNDYRALVDKVIATHFPDSTAIPKDKMELVDLFKGLDLSPVDSLMACKYKETGRRARPPSDMLRSCLVAVAVKQASVTLWVSQMRITPLLAAISGFDPNDIPGVGTFHDFFRRIWDLDLPNLCPAEDKTKPPKIKPPKPEKAGDKAPSQEPEHVEDVLKRLQGTKFDLKNEAYATLFNIFSECFLKRSIETGIVEEEDLRISGDGTPVKVSAQERSHRICDCRSRGIMKCDCDRYYSQPDCDWGWDSSRKYYYYGYDAYFISAAHSNLPLFFILHPASRHDSIGFCETMARFRAYLPNLHPSEITLDSAHDAMPIYHYLRNDGITPFIDLNSRHSGKTTLKEVTFDKNGHPLCPAGLPMKTNGTDKALGYAKFRCPCMETGPDGQPHCTCQSPCSSAKYGRNFSIPLETNVRLFNSPPRGSEEWKKVYNSRTSSERVNKREKNDFELERGHHRSSMMWYIKSYLCMMLVHMRSWPADSEKA